MRPNLLGERLERGAEALVAQDDRLEGEREVAQLADRRRAAGRAPSRARRWASSSLPVAIECSAASSISAIPDEVLYRAVVQEQRNASPLVLLGGDQPVERSSVIRSRLVDDRLTERDRYRMRARVSFELGEDVAHVALDGLLAR